MFFDSIAAALLCWVAISDWRSRIISNKNILLLLIIISAQKVFEGDPDFLGSLTLGLSTLLMGLVLFNLQVWGAGDGKLTAVLLFGIGPVSGQMALFINGCVVATLVTAAVLYYQKDQRRGLPFGIPLAFGYFLVLLT